MAELSLHGRSERLSDIISLDRAEIEMHQVELMRQLAEARECNITRQVEAIRPLLAQIAFELSMRDAEDGERMQNEPELVGALA